jgi:uncharacterized membrane protein YvlD (DUF360 family)
MEDVLEGYREGSPLRKAAYSFLGCIAGAVLCAYLLPGVHAVDWMAAALPGAALGAVYLLLRPAAKLITFPLAIFTLGLLYVALDAALLWMVAQPFDGFEIENFGWAVSASVVINLCRRVCRIMA